MGVMQVGVGIGMGIGPIMGGLVADAFGYRMAFHFTGALLAIAGIIVMFGVDENFNGIAKEKRNRTGFLNEWMRILSAPRVVALYSLRFMNHMGRMIFIPILPMFLLSLLDHSEGVNSYTGFVIGISSIATAFFAMFLGRLGDRIGHRGIIIICSFLCFLFFIFQSLAYMAWHILILQILTGAALGGIVPGISALLARTTQHGDEGVVYGLDTSIVSGARFVGPILGVSIAMGFGLRAVFITAALIYLFAALMAFIALPRA